MTTLRIAIIVSDFNHDITHALLAGAEKTLLEKGVAQASIKIVHVPGAVEIPLIAQKLAAAGEYQAIIALGAVIEGETDHYRAVCDYVTHGCKDVNLLYDVPLIFGVLMTKNEAQAFDRIGGRHGHKGVEAAEAALKVIELIRAL